MIHFLLVVVILFIFWLICNYITDNLLKKNSQDLAIGAVRYRKTIMFDIAVCIILFILNFDFLLWIGISYYIIITILEGIFLTISVISGLDEDIKNKQFDIDLWKVTFAKFLNEISSIVMIFFLFSLLN